MSVQASWTFEEVQRKSPPAAHHTTWVTTPDRICRTPVRTCRIPDKLMVCIDLPPSQRANTPQSWSEHVESRTQLCPHLAPLGSGRSSDAIS